MSSSHNYAPIIADVRMSDYGYWVVTISVSPTQRMSVMVCSVGITRDEASTDALVSLMGVKVRKAPL
jgi:hypothetical protein